MRLSLGRRLVNLLPVAQLTNALTFVVGLDRHCTYMKACSILSPLRLQMVCSHQGVAPNRQSVTVRGGTQKLEDSVALKELCAAGIEGGRLSVSAELHLELIVKEITFPSQSLFKVTVIGSGSLCPSFSLPRLGARAVRVHVYGTMESNPIINWHFSLFLPTSPCNRQQHSVTVLSQAHWDHLRTVSSTPAGNLASKILIHSCHHHRYLSALPPSRKHTHMSGSTLS